MTIHALKARYVFPVSSAPIAGGMVGIQGQRITAVAKKVSADNMEDLGNVAILPGLVNAHTHLEFSNLDAPLGQPGIGFANWIRRIREYRQNKSEGGNSPVEKGLRECSRYGVTTIGEIAQPDWPVTSLKNYPVDGTAFFELIAPTAGRVSAALELAQNCLEGSGLGVQGSELICNKDPEPRTLNPEPCIEPRTMNPECYAWQFGLSPHAPYSVHIDLLQKIIEISVHRQIPLAIHLAESREELQLLAEKSGPLKDLLTDLGAYDPAAMGPGLRPMDYLDMLAVAARVLVVHGNYLSRDEIGLLADYAECMSVVFCPRTHDYFGHDRYPLERMLSAGVTVCLGTDSRASSPDLDLLAEIRHVARLYPDLHPQVALQLGTLEGAKALGRDQDIGTLQAGKYANLAVVTLPKTKTADPYKLLFDCDQPASATWFRGKKV